MTSTMGVDLEVHVEVAPVPTEKDVYSFVCWHCALTRNFMTLRFITPQYTALHLHKHEAAGHFVPAVTWANVETYGDASYYAASRSLLTLIREEVLL